MTSRMRSAEGLSFTPTPPPPPPPRTEAPWESGQDLLQLSLNGAALEARRASPTGCPTSGDVGAADAAVAPLGLSHEAGDQR